MTDTTLTIKKNKGGRPKGSLIEKVIAAPPTDLRTLFDSQIKWNKLLKLMVAEAKGGIKRLNGNGIEYLSAPNADILKWLFEQRFGKAVTRIEGTDDAKEAAKKLARIEQYILPHNISVTNTGKLATEQTTELKEAA